VTGAAAPAPLLWAAREARLAALEALPRGLWLWGLVHSQGQLEARLAGITALRRALLDGGLPSAWQWPPAPLAAGVAAVLADLDLPGYCRGQPDLTETLLRSLLFHLDLIVDYADRGASPGAAADQALEAFREDWAARCGEVDELEAVFGDASDLCKHNRWDLLRGVLKSGGWQEVVRIRGLLERLPELASCIRRLGRARATEQPDEARPSPVQAVMQVTRPVARPRQLRVPDYPGETRGVRRSGRVPRMLPAEAMLLLHPRLRLVWHARHAERTLLTYEDEEVLEEWIHEPEPAWVPSPDRLPDQRREMGPILVCVDTSGSMQGVERLEATDWQLADLLVASDGEFGATPAMAERLRQAKAERGLRVQGVLIGDRETLGFLEIADDIFWVPDWRRFGMSDSGSPVHSKSLTATYFPGALRTPENRAATVGGEAAVAAFRAERKP